VSIAGALGVLAVLIMLGWYLSFSAARLDRLHARVEAARGALDAQLVRRASVALELATSGLLDPAAGVILAAAAHWAREAPLPDRELAESDLSRTLRAVLDADVVASVAQTPPGRNVMRELEVAAGRVELARRFHNDAVRAARTVRRQRVVRALRLAGHAPLPESFEIDDSPPALTVA
jgi:hypothetical protein